ncbi:hypothetical protein [Dechloromonas sp. HYN0024]|uniref:3'-5' exonuclease n=1 Tax=Dechloromonas sp. HYN0024 TaxID=2231055 RepID=UPI000E43E105|nr:hypothetical protein [Dechloromonas sp. HYN0024]AXS81244.1 hypothetical protein HYN24_15110 [Dechloromonas sp. HYN0024]
MPLPVIIDIEASGFGRGSYPVEIGYFAPDGESYCTLILPEPGWTHWDSSAEKVHGITREVLASHGKPAAEVCLALNRSLHGKKVYCDGWAHDYVWLAVMYDAVGLIPSFQLKDLRELLSDCSKSLWHPTRALIETRHAMRRHRASGDARILAETLLETTRQCGGDLQI